jgi:hypothetical protein
MEKPDYNPAVGRGPWAILLSLELLNGNGTFSAIYECTLVQCIQVVCNAIHTQRHINVFDVRIYSLLIYVTAGRLLLGHCWVGL